MYPFCADNHESQHAVWFWVSSVSWTSLHHSDPPSPLSNCTWFYIPVLKIMNLACLIWHKTPTNFAPSAVNGRSVVPFDFCCLFGGGVEKNRKAKVLVAQSCQTLCYPMDCSPPGSSVRGILQARILEWVAIPFSRASPRPGDWTQVSWIAGGFFPIWAAWEAP